MTCNPLGPSQPSMPTIQAMETMSPMRARTMSMMERVKTTSISAMSTKANPSSIAIPDSVASVYSSSMMTGERLLTLSGPWLAVARS